MQVQTIVFSNQNEHFIPGEINASPDNCMC